MHKYPRSVEDLEKECRELENIVEDICANDGTIEMFGRAINLSIDVWKARLHGDEVNVLCPLCTVSEYMTFPDNTCEYCPLFKYENAKHGVIDGCSRNSAWVKTLVEDDKERKKGIRILLKRLEAAREYNT